MAYTGASSSFGGKRVDSVTASFSLSPNDSGKVFVMSGSALTVTLPSISDVSAGYSVTLISGDDSEHILNGGASLIYGHAFDSTAGNDADAMLPLTGHSTITPGAGMLQGDKYDIMTDGTSWYVYIFAGAEVAGS